MESNSWVITCIASGEVFEIYRRDNANKARASGLFIVETATEYLCRINEEIRDAKNNQDAAISVSSSHF